MFYSSKTPQKGGKAHHSAPPHIAIIGARKSGKTTLCASLHQSLIAKAHGFSPNMIARFPDANGLKQLENLFAQRFNAPKNTFEADPAGPVRKIRIGIDFGTSRWSFQSRPNHEIEGYYQIAIDDLRDDYDFLGKFAAHSSAIEQQDDNPLIRFQQSLTQANTLIICQPALQKLAPSESTGFIRLMSDIGTGQYGQFDTIVLAFTKYERIFTKLGCKAFQQATKPSTILKTMATTINQDLAFENGLRALMSKEENGTRLYALPVSAFGFLRQNGAPNIDQLTEQPISALAPLLEQSRAENPLVDSPQKVKLAGFTIPVSKADSTKYSPIPHPSEHWLPFLAADPFLTACSGQPSQFMVPLTHFISALNDGLELGESDENHYQKRA